MAAVQDVPRLILQAILASQSPQALSQQRKDAVVFLEQFKRADVTSVLSACACLMSLQQLAQQYGNLLQPSDVVGVRLAAYQLFTEVVRNRWRELAQDQRTAATQLAFQQFTEAMSPSDSQDAASAMGTNTSGMSPIRGKAAELLAVVIRQQGSGIYGEMLPQLIAGAATGPTQADLSCRVLHYISEDLTQFEVSASGGAVGASAEGTTAEAATSPTGAGNADGPDVTSKRAFLSALTASATTVFPFLCEVLEQHFQAAQQLQSAPPPADAAASRQRADLVAAHVAALSAALGALATWVEWVPMRRLGTSPVLGACAFFIREGTPALRMQALEVLRQITWRKRGNENPSDYAALMDALGGALLGATGSLGLLLGPQDPLPPAMIRELGHGGSLADFGARLLEVLEGLGEGHFRALSEPAGHRTAFLAQLLTFTRHPYLRLSGATLNLWHQLLREAAPQHALAVGGQGGSPSGKSGGSSSQQSYSLPLEVVSQLMQVLCGAMVRVVPAADPGANNLPDWCDSHVEYKDAVVAYRSQTKAILRVAATLAPEQALQAAAGLLSTALAACAAAAPESSAAPGGCGGAAASAPSPNAQLEAAVAVLTAVLQPLCELVAGTVGGGGQGGVGGSGAGVGGGLTAAGQAAAAVLVGEMGELLQALLRVRLSNPKHMTLHAEAIEAFGRFLALRPDMAVPTVSCCLEVMRLLPLEAPGQLPPPARPIPEWRAHFEARLAMANVLQGLARASPSALLPHLSALVTEISALWERGLLREGERVLLWEGLLAAASAAPPHVQSQLLQLIFAPIAAQWGSAEWQATVASPQAFIQAYLPLLPSSTQPGGAPVPAPPASATAGAVGPTPAATAGFELGARDRRWTLYHQVTLLERALRRTTPPTPTGLPSSGSGGAAAASSAAPSTAAAAGASGAHSGSLGGGAPGSGAAAGVPPEHPFTPHLEWCLPPVARLLACIHALADPRVRPALGPLEFVNEMDALERAVRLGEDRDAVKAAEQSEPRCVAGGNLADSRYFLRGVRECAYMVLNLAAINCGAAMWGSAPLAALLPAAVAGGAAALGDHVVRLLVRHVLTPWAQRCPPARAGVWMVPLCGAFVPHMHERLGGGWAALQAPTPASTSDPHKPASSGPGRPPSGAGGGSSGGGSATTDEVLRDTLLRELSREYLGFLNALASRRPVDEPGSGGPAGAAGGGAPGAGAGGTVAATANGAAQSTAPVPQSSLLEVLMAANPGAAQAGLTTGVAALCWPDTDSAARAVVFCRSLLTLAQGGMPELEGVVIGGVTRAAISSLGLGSTVLVQAQVLELLRCVLAAYLPPRQPQSPLLRGVLAELPGVTAPVLEGFSATFLAAHGDKEQRATIKQLLAAVGGDEVRKLLAAVSKVQGGVSAVSEPRHRERGPGADLTPQDMGLPHLFDLPDNL